MQLAVPSDKPGDYSETCHVQHFILAHANRRHEYLSRVLLAVPRYLPGSLQLLPGARRSACGSGAHHPVDGVCRHLSSQRRQPASTHSGPRRHLRGVCKDLPTVRRFVHCNGRRCRDEAVRRGLHGLRKILRIHGRWRPCESDGCLNSDNCECKVLSARTRIQRRRSSAGVTPRHSLCCHRLPRDE